MLLLCYSVHGSSVEGTIICRRCLVFINPVLVCFPHIVLVFPPAFKNMIFSFSCAVCLLLRICHQTKQGFCTGKRKSFSTSAVEVRTWKQKMEHQVHLTTIFCLSQLNMEICNRWAYLPLTEIMLPLCKSLFVQSVWG